MKEFFQRFKPYILAYFVLQTALRATLLMRSTLDIDFSAAELLQIFARGLWLDIVTAGFVIMPVVGLWLLVRRSFWGKKAGYIIESIVRFVFLFSLMFGFVAEHLFWTEFSTRFNFIAVDYLVYTHEVIGNIAESYPVGWIIGSIAIIAVLITHISLRRYPVVATLPITKRAGISAVFVAACLMLYSFSSAQQAQFNDNAEAGEIAANGIYNLFYAFWNNEISYERFYVSEDDHKVEQSMRSLLTENDVHSSFENSSGITRIINPPGNEQHHNVFIIVMESMSADYMGTFGDTKGLTPNLDRLAKEGLLFSQTYATGTRTVRGLEAVTLSVPPTPGQSIVRRPNNDNLFSLGFVFKDRGYDTRFIYGGYGYFDNMNAFFAGNGFDVIDRTSLKDDEIHFANIWGVADDDVFAHAIKEADASYANGKPFLNLIMTTSNHRPYTYPEGHIDIAPKSGRLGGVKYADYSVGKLMEWAEKKPWFKDTVFVFVADHTAGASGKAELDPKKYHIPMIFYGPGIIKQGRYDKIASQIDLGPILLGQLNFRYRSKFYGEDLLHDDDEIPRAFISNYQKVALVKENEITVLEPKQMVKQMTWPLQDKSLEENSELVSETVAYYQSASWWQKSHKREPTVVK